MASNSPARLGAAAAVGAAFVILLRYAARRRKGGLAAWRIVVEPGRGGAPDEYVVERVDGTPGRFVAPDASNRGIHGVPHPPFIRQPNWDALRSAGGLFRESDVVVASFPKTGTTLTEQIVLSLLAGGDAAKLDPSTQNEWDAARGHGKYWVEKVDALGDGSAAEGKRRRLTLAEFAALPSPRVVKTHAPFGLFLGASPSGDLLPGLKVLYVTRDAKDACVSSFYHAANPSALGWAFTAWAKAWACGLFEHGDIWAHRRGWRAAPSAAGPGILWLRYEELLSDPDREIRRIAAFIGVDASEELVAKTRTNAAFDAMKAKAGAMTTFYRRGATGDAKAHFDAATAADFDAIEAREAAAGGGV